MIVEEFTRGTTHDRWFMLPRLADAERSVAADVARLLKASVRPFVDPPSWVRERWWEADDVSLDASQEGAFQGALLSPHGVVVLNGIPGAGKTFLVNLLIKACKRMGLKVALAASTGRAAKIVGEKANHPSSTIHVLLEYNPMKGGFQRNREKPINADIVIGDEWSMVDTELAAALLQAIPTGAKLVAVGDVNQLPSVGAGCVLRDFIDSGVMPVASLTQLHRAAEASWMNRAARRILDGVAPDMSPCHDFNHVDVQDAKDIPDALCQLARTAKQVPQVLIPLKKGPAGVIAANEALRATLNPRKQGAPEFRAGNLLLRTGDVVTQTKNAYDLLGPDGSQQPTMNGDVGRVVDVSSFGLTVEYDNRQVRYEPEDAERLALAYAITVHRSQGGQFPHVAFVAVKAHTFQLNRQLLYTGITRAQERVTIVGSRSAVHAAMRQRSEEPRRTLLKERIQRSMKEAA